VVAGLSSWASRLGLKLGALYEVVVTTSGVDGKPHAAAMGVRLLKRGLFQMRSYGETRTLTNLRATGLGCLNIVRSCEVFFNCLFNPEALSFDSSSVAPRLKGADGWVFFKVLSVEPRGGYYVVTCSPTDFEFRRVKPKPICRAESSLLEALIHSTRLDLYRSMGDEKLNELYKLIEHHIGIVERTGWPELKSMARRLASHIGLS